jgi:hypothetical protein
VSQKPDVARNNPFGLIGVIVGLLALASALLPIWILPLVDPPRSAGQAVVDSAQRLRERAAARLRGEPQQQEAARTDWYRVFSAATVALGLAAFACAVLSFLRREDRRATAVAAALGAGAILIQYTLWAVTLVVAFAIIVTVLGWMGISL